MLELLFKQRAHQSQIQNLQINWNRYHISLNRKNSFYSNRILNLGFCDCGDVPKWKSNPSCSLHQPKEDQHQTRVLKSTKSNPGMPDELFERIHKLMRILLDYIIDTLSYEALENKEESVIFDSMFVSSLLQINKTNVLPSFLCLRVEDDDFVIMGYESEKYKLNDILTDFSLMSIFMAQEKLINMLSKNGRVELGRDKLAQCIQERAYFQVRLGLFAV